jgi:hypothetical protein
VTMVTKRQLEILQHSLGLDQYGRGRSHRNYFCAGVDDEPDCRALVGLGYMEQCSASKIFPDFNCRVTEAGREVVRRESPLPPKLTRSQRRYREFLTWKDACGGTFREFLAWDRINRAYLRRQMELDY